MDRDQHLRQAAYKEIEKHQLLVEQDPYRLHYHIMPLVGLLNDPNGFVQWKGTYHLFYQWMPFETGHGAKFWGHYQSKDLVNWKHEGIALTPAEWFEKNGCYSGSALVHEGQLYVFYTGNVKDEEGNRESYQCLAVSEDGVHFDKKGPVVQLPRGYTAHFRDPKVWEQNGAYFMVIGAQTDDWKGAVVLFTSSNLVDWKHVGIIAGGGKGPLEAFGYMFECPDLFHLDGQDVLVFSPQGLEPDGMKYHNVYQAGYVTGIFEAEKTSYKHGEFYELDHGFDFYAPQTTRDEKGRRILFGWMSVPDQGEQDHPTIQHQWLHNMTLPRELKLVNGKLYQSPVAELRDLREGDAIEREVSINQETRWVKGVEGKALELELKEINLKAGWLAISFGGSGRIVYSRNDQVFTMERESYVDGVVEKRQTEVKELHDLQIFLDTSSIEVFINGGEYVFTSRFYPSPNNESIQFRASQTVSFHLKKWKLRRVF
ncbi:beta-fructofuranosidase [Halobacillus karajensis]|uniref:Sucrose-6-phosphate hydrolase n=1 Tax=Halobacillus karajensis TaxID=195088 RepID=A0A059NVK2_9BACI|nr:sucrose-6-phosphate hydrolase [Halobacillus karajensis]CDQ18534.1 Sucrose-6-phosphate hydrolase [Halobacillus karajensis]CDQ23394.1 Sucrose-6-phosphate hydrolase [Halobacillus karajensis]CDQ26876.1 Sucrose-6-phosphate hydrolase [Halobacillus karajensis]SEH50258.1 beta-fructofuranosidase [Halobacillus karajensis]